MNQSVKFETSDWKVKLGEVCIANVIDSGMVYPQFKSVKDKEIAQCDNNFSYKCDKDQCNFDSCLSSMRNSSELNARGLRNTAVIVTGVIKDNQELFTANEVGGYVLQATGKGHIFIKNDTVDCKASTRIGFLDLTETRRRFIHQHELQKLNVWNSSEIMIGAAGGCAFGVSFTVAALKLLKKIP